jgi:hypothetical protein
VWGIYKIKNLTKIRRSALVSEKAGNMPDIQNKLSKKEKGDTSKVEKKRKSSEFKAKEAPSDNVGKKRKIEQIDHVPSLVSSTFNPLEEIDFPRGGATLTPLERKEAENEGLRDALFEVQIWSWVDADFSLVDG